MAELAEQARREHFPMSARTLTFLRISQIVPSGTSLLAVLLTSTNARDRVMLILTAIRLTDHREVCAAGHSSLWDSRGRRNHLGSEIDGFGETPG